MEHRDRVNSTANTTHVTTEIRGRFKIVGSAAPTAKDNHHADRELATRRRAGRELPSSMHVQSSNMQTNGTGRVGRKSIPRPPADGIGDGQKRPTTRGSSLMHGGVIGHTELVKRGTSMMLGSAANGTMSPGVLRVLAEESRSDCGIIVEKRMKSRSTAKHAGKRGYGYCTDSWGTVDNGTNFDNEEAARNDTAGAFK